MPAGREKRRDQRVPTDVRLRSSAPSEIAEMEAVNLSLGGVSCYSLRRIEPMTRLHVVLDLPGELGKVDALAAEAVVVRLEEDETGGPPYRLALWFQNMGSPHRTRLRRFLGLDGN